MCIVCAEFAAGAVVALTGWRLWAYKIRSLWRSVQSNAR